MGMEEYDDEMTAQEELDAMQSPICGRKEISPDLDELEEEFFEAFTDYRENETYNDFTHYKDYYQDAIQANKMAGF